MPASSQLLLHGVRRSSSSVRRIPSIQQVTASPGSWPVRAGRHREARRCAGRDRPRARVHLGIDTGLSRGGLRPEGGVAAARRLLGAGLSRLEGTWSHLATAGDARAVASQVSRFEAVLAALRAAGIDPGLRHLDATGGLLAGMSPGYELVRVGLAFYGVVPPDAPVAPGMAGIARGVRPALSLRARAATVTAIETGAAVGYGGTWIATRPSGHRHPSAGLRRRLGSRLRDRRLGRDPGPTGPDRGPCQQ